MVRRTWTQALAWAIGLAALLPADTIAQGGDPLVRRADVPLIQPLGALAAIPTMPGVGMFLTYFNSAVPWLFDVAIGFCAIWVVIGGIRIMASAGGGEKGEGINNIKYAVGGLLILIFAGTILKTLNNFFYK